MQKAKTLNINVDSEVTKYMTNLQRQAGIPDMDKFHDYVRQGTGMTYEDYLSETKNQMMTREVIGQEVGRHISVSDAEVQDYYDKHKSDFVREEKVYLSEILVSTEGKNAAGIAAAEKKAKQLADQASKGGRFSDLARDNSDATTAKTGGQLGARIQEGRPCQAVRRCCLESAEGRGEPADPDRDGIRNSEGGRSHQGGSRNTGRCQAGDREHSVWSEDAAQGSRVSDNAAEISVPADQARLRGYRRGSWSEHQVAGSGAVEAGDGDQSRSGTEDAAQAAALGDSDSRHRNNSRGKEQFALAQYEVSLRRHARAE